MLRAAFLAGLLRPPPPRVCAPRRAGLHCARARTALLAPVILPGCAWSACMYVHSCLDHLLYASITFHDTCQVVLQPAALRGSASEHVLSRPPSPTPKQGGGDERGHPNEPLVASEAGLGVTRKGLGCIASPPLITYSRALVAACRTQRYKMELREPSQVRAMGMLGPRCSAAGAIARAASLPLPQTRLGVLLRLPRCRGRQRPACTHTRLMTSCRWHLANRSLSADAPCSCNVVPA